MDNLFELIVRGAHTLLRSTKRYQGSTETILRRGDRLRNSVKLKHNRSPLRDPLAISVTWITTQALNQDFRFMITCINNSRPHHESTRTKRHSSDPPSTAVPDTRFHVTYALTCAPLIANTLQAHFIPKNSHFVITNQTLCKNDAAKACG